MGYARPTFRFAKVIYYLLPTLSSLKYWPDSAVMAVVRTTAINAIPDRT